MKERQLLIALVGLFIESLGLLWFLQGAAILRLCPVLCVSKLWMCHGRITVPGSRGEWLLWLLALRL